jgi:hypothetical protein
VRVGTIRDILELEANLWQRATVIVRVSLKVCRVRVEETFHVKLHVLGIDLRKYLGLDSTENVIAYGATALQLDTAGLDPTSKLL